MGVTQKEITEVLHVAMTVGATRMQVMARAESAKLEPPATEAPSAGDAATAATATPEAGAASPSFEAAEVTAQADGG